MVDRLVTRPGVLASVHCGLLAGLIGCTATVETRFDNGGSGLGESAGTGGVGKTGDSSASGPATTTAASDSDSTSSDDSGGLDVKYDVGKSTDGSDPDPMGGCDKVDFLFVIDNSTSMHNEQTALVDAYDDFMLEIEAAIAATDYHVMVVDTDAQTRCTKQACNDDTPSNKVVELCLDPAGGYACEAGFTACDKTLGAGVVHPAGDEASNAPCPLQGDKRYLDGTDDLVGTFGCTARVGTAGHPAERPMDAMLAALSNPDGCNDGFLRDDAILVVTFITDDPCYEDTGIPLAWYEAVVQAKHDDPTAVVMVGIIPSFTCHYNPNSCASVADAAGGSHWKEFIQLWGDHGLLGDVCAFESYADLFAEAVTVIDATCDAFEPPG